MFLFAAVLLAALSATGAVANDYNPLLSGFRDASIVHSSGGKAVCAAGNVWVNITTTNIKLLFEAPSNQTVVTETLQELLQANPTIYARTNGGNNTFSARYRIYARLCYPTSVPDRKQVKTVQLLTHGLTLDHGYWDIPGFSYVDAAAEAGYATLSYDRLGIGQSEHPDPVQVVQLAPQFEIAHGLAQLLRAGALGGHAFGSVVGAGHSLGSVVTAGVTAKYPRDFDAAIITGLTVNGTYGLVISAALDFHIANQQNPRFGGLANGYLTPPLQSGVQFAFWRWPYFEQSVLDTQFARSQTAPWGELFTFTSSFRVSPDFKAPVDVVLARYDMPFCGADCTYPTDLGAATLAALYPNAAAASKSVLIENSGHNINAHFGAASAYAQINAFLKANGL